MEEMNQGILKNKAVEVKINECNNTGWTWEVKN